MNKIIYIGNSLQTAEVINNLKEVEVVAVIFQKEKVSQEELARYSIFSDKIGVSSKNELQESLQKYYGKIDFAVMYSFGIILPETITQNIEVYNFHPGDLRDNRGSSPINWSILLNRRETKMTLHRVGKEIDLGEVISEHSCAIYPHDVPSTLRARLNGEIPSIMIELLAFRERKRDSINITQGIYRDRICEADYTIHGDDSEEIIDAKIRSQYDYSGAILIKNGKRIVIRDKEAYCKEMNCGGYCN